MSTARMTNADYELLTREPLSTLTRLDIERRVRLLKQIVGVKRFRTQLVAMRRKRESR